MSINKKKLTKTFINDLITVLRFHYTGNVKFRKRIDGFISINSGQRMTTKLYEEEYELLSALLKCSYHESFKQEYGNHVDYSEHIKSVYGELSDFIIILLQFDITNEISTDTFIDNLIDNMIDKNIIDLFIKYTSVNNITRTILDTVSIKMKHSVKKHKELLVIGGDSVEILSNGTKM